MVDSLPTADASFGAVPRGRRVVLDGGRRAFVRIAGERRDAPPVVLLHGLGATSALNWEGCYGPLAERSLVAALDHRGHGRGERCGNRFRLVDCADDAAALIRTLDAGPAIVVGYSMGGPIAQLLALRHPDLVAGLVFAATARDFRGRTAERLRFATIAALATGVPLGPRALAPPMVPVLPGRWKRLGWALAELRRHEPAALISAAAALGRFSSREWIAGLDVPAAVIVHTDDRLVPPHRQHKLAASLPDAVVFPFEGDHLAVARDTDAYVDVLARALDSVRARSQAAIGAVIRPAATVRNAAA